MLRDKNMQILDRKLKKYFPNYTFQSLLATISLTIILYFENIFNCPGDSGLVLVLFHASTTQVSVYFSGIV